MLIVPLGSADPDLETQGGKGANLVRLVEVGFRVPAGFILTTEAYRSFVTTNRLGERIASATSGLVEGEPSQLERASSEIRPAFADGEVPPDVAAALRKAYAELGPTRVAVRSSATLEDLPDLSFAGQQDTFLNVEGEGALLRAVVDCWSSLWTARALGYRIRNEIGHQGAALAVVVQEMVASEVSGVLFSVNPLSGSRRETVIDSTFGLGEALVSGGIEPDHFVVDHLSGSIVEKRLGTKVEARAGEAGWSLDEDRVRQLAQLGQRVQEAFDGPQDIEWALADGHLHLLQTRPITSLYPVPRVSFDPLTIWFSFGAVQGLLGPMTPLGRQAVQSVLAGAGRLFGLRLEPQDFELVASAGERLWIKISDLLRNPIGNRVLGPAVGYVEPSVARIVRKLAEEPDVGAGGGKIRARTFLRIARFVLPAAIRGVRTLLLPAAARARFDASIESYLEEAKIEEASDRSSRLAKALDFMRSRTSEAFGFLLPRFIPVFAPGMAALTLLNRLAGEDRSLVLEVTRGIPNNVTTEMDLALWRVAIQIGEHPESATALEQLGPAELAARYLARELPAVAQTTVGDFLHYYGVRGTGEIDIGRPRWEEDPSAVMQTLQSYLAVEAEAAPDLRFERGATVAQTAVDRLAARARGQRAGRIKEMLVRAAARRVRILLGARESPKFFAIRVLGRARRALLAAGEDFAQAGTISEPDDLFYLRILELAALADGETRDWKALIFQRRAAYRREERRRQVPRVLVSDGRAFYEGLGAEADAGDAITGSPVSPGEVEGVVRVVLDPHGAQLEPGEILVCAGTDPAWTPLFVAAGGLITEVGGMMTHGSVVAREFGIPAVVGVHQATQHLKDGQRVRLNGSNGRIEVVD